MMLKACRSALVALALLAITTPVAASSLQDHLQGLFGPQGITLRPDPQFNHVAHFSSTSAAVLGILVQQLAQSAADFQSLSTNPGVTYRFNQELGLFEPTPGAPGAVFVDIPQTIGKNRFNFGLSYQYLDFNELNGEDLNGLHRTLVHQDTKDQVPPPTCTVHNMHSTTNGLPGPGDGNPCFENDTITVTFDNLAIRSHVWSLFATYGITDRWDVNILLPLVYTQLNADARAVINDVSTSIHRFPDGGVVDSESSDGDHFGVGDLLLRTKYRFTDNDMWNAASSLVLRVPTGSNQDFQGLGDVVLSPFFVGGVTLGRHDIHTNLGFDINPEHLDRSRARYALGGSLSIIDGLSMQVDFLGSSNLEKQDASITVPVFSPDLNNPTPETPIAFQKQTISFRTDIFNLAMGLKYNPVSSVVLFAGAIKSLNDDGLRASVVPYGGVEASF